MERKRHDSILGIHVISDNIPAAIRDIRESLALLDPRVSPVLYRWVIANPKRSQERAKLDWLTAQVRYKLGKGKPYELRAMMERGRVDFLSLGFELEAVAIGADLMKMKLAKRQWGAGTARDMCRSITSELLTVPRLSAEVIASLHQVAERF